MSTALKVGSRRRKKLGRRMHRLFANSPPSILAAINRAFDLNIEQTTTKEKSR